ncbi:NAD(P)-binding protein [Aaosphaeria arxii CBS 175.79]|uniref:NAD(P)-binding protein n=1 Tax=Aaosphaeria arxii CBS 175.79 TaxID=1450172 RepID=A0A6A5Y3B6_9PLEO|nr:NAD(P)-binding protein [Aaosphaeria arxii CBS 175.79]KAF2019769.1 NAD(P)-binding protein [Aaosphaeria arxii CBS 175.79]
MELKKIAIVGPRGSVGKEVISQLLKHTGRFQITAISRQSPDFQFPTDADIIHKLVDFDSFESLKASFLGKDAVINCINGAATQFLPTKLIIDAAVEAGVRFYFANEFVGDIMREEFRRLPEQCVGGKVRTRAYLEKLSEGGKICWTALNGGPFFDMCKGPAGFDIPNRKARIYGTGNTPLFWTPLPTIAETVVNMVLHPSYVANRAVHIAPIRGVTQNSILACLESILETRFTVEKVDIQKIFRHASIALERGDAANAMKGLATSYQFMEGDTAQRFADLVKVERFDVPEISMHVAIRDALQRYGTDCPVAQAFFNIKPCDIQET